MSRLLKEHYTNHHKLRKRIGQTFSEQLRGDLFAKWIGVGAVVLDIGCRDCKLTKYFSNDNIMVGLDIDYDALLHCKNTEINNLINADLGYGLPFNDHIFDVVVCGEVLEHVIIPDILLLEIKRVLKVGGKFVGSVPTVYHLQNRLRVLRGKRLDNDPTHTQHFSYSYLIDTLSKFFDIRELVAIEGQKWAKYSMRLFARHVAFLCSNE
jgi:SAM-dependent methyltransferase